MFNLIKKSLGITLVALSLISTQILAENGKPFTLTGSQTYNLTSKTNNKIYEIQIQPPQGFHLSMCNKMATLYQTDGNWSFANAVGVSQRLSMVRVIPPMLVVGIGYPNASFIEAGKRRKDDLMPSHSIASLGKGDADGFAQFIRDQVMPFVEQKYCRTQDRIISGFSLGGTFATYALFNYPDMFNRYLIGSPNYRLANNSVLHEQETKYAKNNKDLNKYVYLSSGSLEGPQMVPGVFQMGYALESRHFPNLKLMFNVATGEDHLTYSLIFLSQALRHVYSTMEPKVKEQKSSGNTSHSRRVKK